jgi:hypothetical protein
MSSYTQKLVVGVAGIFASTIAISYLVEKVLIEENVDSVRATRTSLAGAIGFTTLPC